MVKTYKTGRVQLLPSPEGDVDFLELVKASQDTGPSHASQNVGSGSLHQGHEAFVLHNLGEAINGSLVLDSTTGGHHHPPPDGVDGVGHEASGDGDSPAKEEGQSHSSISSQNQRLQSVVQTKVHPTVDEDTDSGDGESSVESLDTVGLQGLGVDIDETVELPLTTLALGVIGKPGPGVVQGVDEHQGECPSKPSTGDVGAKLHPLRGVLGGLEENLDLILEGEVEGLGGEVSEHVSQISSPEGIDSLGLENSHGAVSHPLVGLVQPALLDHLILVLYEELDSLNWSSGSLGDSSSHAGEHEVLSESQFLVSHVD